MVGKRAPAKVTLTPVVGEIRTAPTRVAPRGLLALLCAFSFTLSMNNGLLNPVLPEVARDLGVTVAVAGQLATASLLVGAVSGLVAGILSDLYGRRRFLAAGFGAIGLGALALAFAPDYVVALLSRLLAGCGFVMAVNLAVAGDWYRGATRDRAAARMLAAEALAWVAGVPLLAVIADFLDWRAGTLCFAVLALTMSVLAWFAVPRTAQPRPDGGLGKALAAIWQEHRGRTDLLLALLANATRNMYWIGFTTYASAFYVFAFHLETWQIGPVLTVCSIAFIAGAEAGGRSITRLGTRFLATASALTAGVLVAVLPAVSPFAMSLAVATGFCAAAGVLNSALVALVLRLAPASRGTTLAANGALTNLGAALGVSIGGLGIALFGYGGLGLSMAALAFLAAALLWLPAARHDV